jgi:hypothetical protein
MHSLSYYFSSIQMPNHGLRLFDFTHLYVIIKINEIV